MGALLSFLRNVYSGCLALLSELSENSRIFDELLRRIDKPSFPVDQPTASYWQENPVFPDLVHIQSNDGKKLPEMADIVIIGSGISGASIAYTILHECEDLKASKRVVMLEARNVCSGATGRNGGHIKCAPYESYARYKARFGSMRAKKLVKFEMLHLPMLVELAEGEGFVAGEVREVETIDVFIESTMWEKSSCMVKLLHADCPGVAPETKLWEPAEARKLYRLGGPCQGAISFRAGALWPYRLITSIFSSLLSLYPSFSIETNTPATAITTQHNPIRPFLVHTPRGQIATTHVIHATDAFAPNLVPGLKGKLFPVRGHMTAQRPGTSFPDDLDGKRSWSIIGKRGFEYIIQRPGNTDSEGRGGELMVGGGLFQSEERGFDEVGVWRDDSMSTTTSAYLGGIMPIAFGREGWGEDPSGSRIIQAWTGCMGFTPDLFPYVGRLDSQLTGRKVKTSLCSGNEKSAEPAPSEWISAGFNGEGMVLGWLSGVAVGLMVLGRDREHLQKRFGRPEGKVHDWLPSELICTPQRVAASSVYDLARLI